MQEGVVNASITSVVSYVGEFDASFPVIVRSGVEQNDWYCVV